jgi:hypothetical protein
VSLYPLNGGESPLFRKLQELEDVKTIIEYFHLEDRLVSNLAKLSSERLYALTHNLPFEEPNELQGYSRVSWNLIKEDQVVRIEICPQMQVFANHPNVIICVCTFDGRKLFTEVTFDPNTYKFSAPV